MKKLIFSLAAAVLIAGCGQSSGGKSSPTPSEPKISTASDVAAELTKAGLPVKDVRAVTEANDSNHLMGRPGQYVSKVFFYDGRHPKVAETDEGENTIEVFASDADATKRRDYIEGVTANMPIFLQYQLLNGRTLVRLDKVMTPKEVEAYKAALAKIEIE